MKQIIFASAVSLLLTSCVNYTQVRFAKAVSINPEIVKSIKNILVVNRTAKPKNSNNAENVFEGILTGEAIGADKRGAVVAIQGLNDGLNTSLNYKGSTILPFPLYGSGNNSYPKELPWNLVDSLCKQYNADALIALEFFDSNGGLSMGITNRSVPVGYGTHTNNVSVRSFWRYYDVKSRLIIDDFDERTVSGSGGYRSSSIPVNVLNKYQATSDAGFWAGMEYAYRVSEQMITESRVCYRGGNYSMRKAGRLAWVGDWETAANIWIDQTKSAKRKIRARAYNNLALYNEQKGNLEMAFEAATKSVGEKYYHNSALLVTRLKWRMEDRQRLISNSNN